jgi:cytochrome c2
MKKILLVIFISTLSVVMSSSLLAADAKKGKELYDAKCHGCHDTRIHTRPNRIIHTYSDLVNRVKFCDNASKAGFSDSDMADVTEYLNDTFYKFIKD